MAKAVSKNSKKQDPPKRFLERLSSNWGSLLLIGAMLSAGAFGGVKYQESKSNLEILKETRRLTEEKDKVEEEKIKIQHENNILKIKNAELESIIHIHEKESKR